MEHKGFKINFAKFATKATKTEENPMEFVGLDKDGFATYRGPSPL
jgi:hypothetical protein